MSRPGAPNRVDVLVTETQTPTWLARYRGFCRRLLKALGRTGTEVSVLLTSDRQVRALNHRYRGLDRATDVLSFEQRGVGEPSHLGDVVISLPAAARNAGRFDVGLEEEVCRLTTHGLLHLEGHDHRTTAERRRMIARQEELLLEARGIPGGEVRI